MPNLNTDFKDDILDISNPERKYQLIYNPDGTVSLRDVTVYQQTGSLYGAKEVNEERAAINKINNDRIVTLDEIDLVNQAGFFVDALAVKELNSTLDVNTNTIGQLMQSDGLPGAAMKFYQAENLTYGCFATGCYIYPGYSSANGAPDDWGGLLIVYKTPESYVKYALTRGGAMYHMINKADGQVEQSWTKLCGKY